MTRIHFGRLGLLLFLLVAAASCAPGPPPAESPLVGQSDWTSLVEKGRQYSAQGQSIRAEQYFLAAEDAGAPSGEVFEAVIETCVSSGRLGRALSHVQRRLKYEPDRAELLRLSATLNEALGHTRLMWERVERLANSPELEHSHVLFLAEFYERQGERERALFFYGAYLRDAPVQEREPWVSAVVRRLKASQPRVLAVGRGKEKASER